MFLYDASGEIYPGTNLEPQTTLCVDGKCFLHSLFAATGGLMLSQIREISGIETPTLQNWVARGYVQSPANKKYNMNQVARILLINMLRSVTKIDQISKLLTYLNGNPNDRSDDIIEESVLYDNICMIIDQIYATEKKEMRNITEQELDLFITKSVKTCHSDLPGSQKKLEHVLKLILLYYNSYLIKKKADNYFSEHIN